MLLLWQLALDTSNINLYCIMLLSLSQPNSVFTILFISTYILTTKTYSVRPKIRIALRFHNDGARNTDRFGHEGALSSVTYNSGHLDS